jgi:hypothetical protein
MATTIKQRDDLDDEVTEIDLLDVTKVSAVEHPAHGIPYLLMKSAAPAPAPTPVIADAVEIVATAIKSRENLNPGGPDQHFQLRDEAERPQLMAWLNQAGFGDEMSKSKTKVRTVVKSDSAESDAILALVTGEDTERSDQFRAAKGVFLDPAASLETKRVALTIMKGEVQDSLRGEQLDPMPQHNSASDINAVAKSMADPDHIVKLRVLHKQEGLDPVVKERAWSVLARHDLRKHAEAERLVKGASSSAPVVSSNGGVIKDIGLVRQLAGDGGKGVAGLVAADKDRATRGQPASIGGVSGIAGLQNKGPRDQVATLGSRAALGATGKIEAEPSAHPGSVGGEGVAGEMAKALRELDELVAKTKPGSITDRERDLRMTVAKCQLTLQRMAGR